jgi:hypothetical protein
VRPSDPWRLGAGAPTGGGSTGRRAGVRTGTRTWPGGATAPPARYSTGGLGAGPGQGVVASTPSVRGMVPRQRVRGIAAAAARPARAGRPRPRWLEAWPPGSAWVRPPVARGRDPYGAQAWPPMTARVRPSGGPTRAQSRLSSAGATSALRRSGADTTSLASFVSAAAASSVEAMAQRRDDIALGS